MPAPTEIDGDGFSKRPLSRYMPLARFQSMLSEGLYVAPVWKFEDIWEGLLGVQLRERMREEKGTRYAYGRSDYEDVLRWVHVSCWYDGVKENAVMWRGYGGAGDAVMIESSAAKLERLYRESPEFYVAHMDAVTYHPPGDEPRWTKLPSLIARYDMKRPDPLPDKPDPVTLLPELFLKYDHYEGEKEFRLVTLNKRYRDPGEEPGAYRLRFDRSTRFIDRVRVSPRATEEYFQKVREMCFEFDPDLRVERSEIGVR
ncbi:DUF2971 domain-containing protein [Luteolibacter luteus]|uniref:DUF2971 domain-containing protein n=1 Tax=Luteolibacter luteus TaxID=2728835 RepID=A0A858RCE0_9BACT|nr:DUF2971 domain-containing protein [Luteolibacter luteus]QJE94355.1 DUF2971 domain-containing protein [Luteolibacter luteus]